MKQITAKLSFLLLSFTLFCGCSSQRLVSNQHEKETTISSIKFLSEYVLPNRSSYNYTLVGGLSGIDYDAENNQYFIISDDPSQFGTARIYTAKIDISNNKIDTVKFTGVTYMQQENGEQYPKLGTTKKVKADGESVRYNPLTKQLLWSSEGERLFKGSDTIIVQPTLTNITLEGKFVDTIPLPAGFQFTKTENGVRKNALFEGTTYADHYKTIYASLEEPRYEDGPKAAFEYDKALTRILKFDAKSKKNTAQYAYNLGALPVKPTVDMDWNVNGISEILAVNDHTLLVMERAWAKGNDDHTFIKLFLVDLNDAENEINNPSFIQNPPKPLKKKLLFDFDTLNRYIDNFEGVTFGPKLPNGHNTLIFMVDDNFAKTERGQFFLFEVMP
ncbi:esterase-like activity of phytase family protein [Pedobacter punctiformis]|uniref:Esterase-like activity of phytase family protein n=1 Tax=Pedobacter punctiformis TaxID=3004097 RepID=A0ABT4L435_9SPHI|nr:esterase-like activity of phytase family protein [Pedobacter sp. HCMS5-2]MCZ4242691.1 esterase-like activity of phytase family protein [Pedobacter sp. HCMS5-2]